MRFRRDSPEECCGKVVPGSEEKYGDLGGLACMRTAGHAGECEPTGRDAANMDGVCYACRAPLNGPHRADCDRRKRTVYLAEQNLLYEPWSGPGWYWIDPDARDYSPPARVTGPYRTEEEADAEYWAYCEAMTI